MIHRSNSISSSYKKTELRDSSRQSNRYYNLYLRQKWSDGKFSIKGNLSRRFSKHSPITNRLDPVKVNSLRSIHSSPEKRFNFKTTSLRTINNICKVEEQENRKEQRKSINCFGFEVKADESAIEEIITVDFNREYCDKDIGSYSNSTVEDESQKKQAKEPKRKSIYFLNESETSDCDSDYIEI